MVTEITGMGSNYPVVGQTPAAATPAVSTSAQTTAVPGSSSDPAASTVSKSTQSAQTVGLFARSQERQTVLNDAATSVRDTGRAVQHTLGLLDQTKQSLNQIVKMWPPYPAGSTQREAILNDVAGLRKMVEQLTFPPAESLKQVGQVLGPQSGSAGTAGVQGVAAAVKDGMAGLAALNPSSASDAAVGQALGQVDALHTKLQSMSTGMWRDVVNFVEQAASPEVHKQGAGVGRQLAGLSSASVGGNGTMLQQVAESK